MIAALAAITHARALSQSPSRPIEDRLYAYNDSTFIGIWSQGELARLSVLDRRFVLRYESSSYGLMPIDIAWPVGSTSAILLAYPLGAPALFRVPITAAPAHEIFWRGTGPPYRRIVATGDFNRDGEHEVAIVGDSAFAIVGLGGTMMTTLHGSMIDAYALSGGDRFVLLMRQGANVMVSMFDARTMRVVDEQQVQLTGTIHSLMDSEGQPTLALASSQPNSTAYVLQLQRSLASRPFAMHDPVFTLVPLEIEGRTVAAALTREYPLRLVPLALETPTKSIEYPLSTVFDAVAVGSRHIAVIATDSVAIYSREWKLLGTAASPGTGTPRLTELADSSLLLATREGSIRIRLDPEGPSWLARNWPLLLWAILALLVLGTIAALAMRYLHVQSIYFNLVGVPSSHGVIVLSRTQRVTQMNGSARELLGISSYIPLGRHIGEYITRDELRGVIALLRRLFIDGESFEQRIDIDTGEGSRALTFRGRTMLTRAGFRGGYLLLVEDVTSTIAQERLINWASVAHHIAHEMKTPLGTVRMTAEMLRDRLSANGRDEEYLRATTRILRQSERLREIVDDLLTVARTESLQRSRADFSLLIASLAHDYREYLPSNVSLEVTISGEDHRCLIDVQQVTVAIRNLLDNARHAIGGRDDGHIRINVDENDVDVMLAVEDNGVGMTAETLASLFQPFYSEREDGSGIGTVIIKRVFEAHGGAVSVASSPGHGTKFEVRIPREP